MRPTTELAGAGSLLQVAEGTGEGEGLTIGFAEVGFDVGDVKLGRGSNGSYGPTMMLPDTGEFVMVSFPRTSVTHRTRQMI